MDISSCRLSAVWRERYGNARYTLPTCSINSFGRANGGALDGIAHNHSVEMSCALVWHIILLRGPDMGRITAHKARGPSESAYRTYAHGFEMSSDSCVPEGMAMERSASTLNLPVLRSSLIQIEASKWHHLKYSCSMIMLLHRMEGLGLHCHVDASRSRVVLGSELWARGNCLSKTCRAIDGCQSVHFAVESLPVLQQCARR